MFCLGRFESIVIFCAYLSNCPGQLVPIALIVSFTVVEVIVKVTNSLFFRNNKISC